MAVISVFQDSVRDRLMPTAGVIEHLQEFSNPAIRRYALAAMLVSA
ncbi:MAG: hypothetical protein WBO55_17775 [Rhizobiaceae bacterium]